MRQTVQMPPGKQGGGVENDVRLPGFQNPHNLFGVQHIQPDGVHPRKTLGRPLEEIDGNQAVGNLPCVLFTHIANHHMQAGKPRRQMGRAAAHSAKAENEQGFGHDRFLLAGAAASRGRLRRLCRTD